MKGYLKKNLAVVVCISNYLDATGFYLLLENLHYSYHPKTPNKPLRVPCYLPVKQQC